LALQRLFEGATERAEAKPRRRGDAERRGVDLTRVHLRCVDLVGGNDARLLSGAKFVEDGLHGGAVLQGVMI
jgi:hypothetical protein